jgi:hypothetical protein
MTEERTVHPTGIHHEPTKSHTVDQTNVHGDKWSEEASMVGSDVREGLGKYKDVRPTTGATDVEQTRGTGAVHETGHTDSSVYAPRDMTDTASKAGSDQREGLGTAAKGDATVVDKGYVEKEHKHKHKHEHHHKHDTNVLPVTSHTTTTTKHDTNVYPATTYHTTTTTIHDTHPTTYAGSGYPGSTTTSYTGSEYPGSTTTSYEKTDMSGTPSKHYGTHTGTHTGLGGYTDTTYGGDYRGTSKLGSDTREGLGSGTGAAYGTSSHTSSTFGGTTGGKTSGWSDTANKTGSDVREGLGSGTSTHTTQGTGQQYQ